MSQGWSESVVLRSAPASEALRRLHEPRSDLPSALHSSSTQDFVAEWVPLSGLGRSEVAWAGLARRAASPNVFLEPGFALAAAPVWGAEAGAVLVWSATGPRRLFGFFPARIEARRYGLRAPVLVGWTHPYAPLGTPLVDAQRASAVVGAWLDFVQTNPALPDRVLLPLIPQESAFAQALAAALQARGARQARFARHSRAFFRGDRDAVSDALRAKKRKELRRQMRRLAGAGGARLESSQDDDWPQALRDYQRLEAAGWKGRAGTAIVQNPAVQTFVDRAIGALVPTGQVAIHRLVVGERTVAAAITLRSGDAGWFWKIAYDESAARASPGVQLALELTRALAQDEALDGVDSCAVADHPMINHLWRGRLAIADHLIAVGPDRERAFRLACALETARRALASSVKLLLRRRSGRR